MEKLFETGKGKINCRLQGQGSPILLLHGWGGCIDSFLPVANALEGNHTVYSIDFPGFGNSPVPALPWTIYDYADAVEEFMELAGIKGCGLIAHSFGCRVAVIIAARTPGAFNKIIMTGAAGLKKKRNLKYYIKVYSYKAAKRFLKTFNPGKLEELNKKAGSPDYRALPDGMKKTFVNVVNEDLGHLLGSIKSPVLLLWGRDDKETPLYMGRRMEKEIPDAGFVELGGGHFAYLDSFAEFIKIAKVFLEG